MTAITILFLVIDVIVLFAVKKEWGALPLLIGACYFSLAQDITLGPLHLPPLRILILATVIRVFIKREKLDGLYGLDWLMIIWGAWAVICSLFQNDPISGLVNHLGLVYNDCGIFFLLRIFCKSLDDTIRLCRITAVLLFPLAAEMVIEKMTGHNFFSLLGGVPEFSEVRNGTVRAQGPFGHSILAGTVGGVCLPLMIGIWQENRNYAILGIIACTLMVFSSSSSGPIMTTAFGVMALCLWYWRNWTWLFKWLVIFGYIALDIIMNAPAYYIMSYIDFTGSSTSWHRAVLIEQSIKHFSEWWAVGTDYTRHWLPYGVVWSPKHIDITNQYIRMGVDGGLPLMLLFIAIIIKGFTLVGQILKQSEKIKLSQSRQFLIWTLGASLFTHAATFMSVAYFDQSFIFIYLTLVAIYSGTVQTISSTETAYIEKPKKNPIKFSRLKTSKNISN